MLALGLGGVMLGLGLVGVILGLRLGEKLAIAPPPLRPQAATRHPARRIAAVSSRLLVNRRTWVPPRIVPLTRTSGYLPWGPNCGSSPLVGDLRAQASPADDRAGRRAPVSSGGNGPRSARSRVIFRGGRHQSVPVPGRAVATHLRLRPLGGVRGPGARCSGLGQRRMVMLAGSVGWSPALSVPS